MIAHPQSRCTVPTRYLSTNLMGL